jgi:mitochondrial fission protein ELM1
MTGGMSCWCLTEGVAGAENQCIGLAEAMGLCWGIKRVPRPSFPLGYLPVTLWPTQGLKDILSPPWPDILISSGRGSVAGALAVRRASAGKTFMVHIQKPYAHPSLFDLIVVPQHDSLRGYNVLVVRTALHRVTQKTLLEAAQHFSARLSHLSRPLITVLVGGSSKYQKFSLNTIHRLADQLIAAQRESQGSLAVTASRRTGEENAIVLRERLRGVPHFFWDGTGENPYHGLLALADAIVATSDSVTMVSEACATGKPVHIFDTGARDRKLSQFHAKLRADGVTRSFAGKVEQWSYDPLNETGKIAGIVLAQFRRRRAG